MRGLLCAAVLALVASAALGRHLAQEDANCQAYSSLAMTVIGNTCWAESSAYCSAIGSSTSAYEEAFDAWFADDYYGNICNSGKAEAAASAVAQALAAAYTSAYQAVECKHPPSEADAQSSFCGWTHSNGDAWAIASAEAIANAVASAGLNGEGFCLSNIRAISVVVADVAASSLIDGCQNGITSSYQFTSSYQTSLQVGIVEAFAKATASSCPSGYYDASASASAECEGSATSTDSGSTESSGDGFASGGAVDACGPDVQDACCRPSFTKPVCFCHQGDCRKQAFQRTSNDPTRTWVRKGGDGAKCFCP